MEFELKIDGDEKDATLTLRCVRAEGDEVDSLMTANILKAHVINGLTDLGNGKIENLTKVAGDEDGESSLLHGDSEKDVQDIQ